MSRTTTTSSPSPTGACGNLYDTPIRDAVCAMPFSNTHIGYMSTCCKDAEVVSYYDDCGLYCQAKGQSVEDLIKCLYDEGAKWEDVFCRGSEQATATGDGKPLPSSDARVVDDDEREQDDNDEDDDNNDNKTSETTTPASDNSDNAASDNGPKAVFTLSAIVTSALLLSGALFSAL